MDAQTGLIMCVSWNRYALDRGQVPAVVRGE